MRQIRVMKCQTDRQIGKQTDKGAKMSEGQTVRQTDR